MGDSQYREDKIQALIVPGELSPLFKTTLLISRLDPNRLTSKSCL
jgi:hypothetical protein